MTYLSPHFSLEEMTQSQTASRLGLDNTPSPEVVEQLKITAQCLEGVRTLLGKPMLVSSGYRSPEVNTAVGSVAPKSAHIYGYAADFIAPGFGSPADVCRAIAASSLIFDQLLAEGTWVHISFDPRMRRQVMTKTDNGFSAGISS